MNQLFVERHLQNKIDELSTQQWHLKWGRPQDKAGKEFCAEGTAQSKFLDNHSWADNTHSASPAFNAAVTCSRGLLDIVAACSAPRVWDCPGPEKKTTQS